MAKSWMGFNTCSLAAPTAASVQIPAHLRKAPLSSTPTKSSPEPTIKTGIEAMSLAVPTALRN